MDQDVRDAVERYGPHHQGNVWVIFFEDVADRSSQVLEEVVGVVVLAVHAGRLPIIEEVLDDLANPLRAFGIFFPRAALLSLVVMALDDSSARNAAKRQGDSCFSEILRLEGHGLKHHQFGRSRHLIPGAAFEGPPGLLLLYAAPLLKEEGYAALQALIPDAGDPFQVHGPRVRS